MIKKVTMSIDETLHLEFQKLIVSKGSNVSKAVSEFMKSELNGHEDLIKDLIDKVDSALDRIDALEEEPGGLGD